MVFLLLKSATQVEPNQGDTACLPDRQAWLIIINSF
jgi:hypothetical protein